MVNQLPITQCILSLASNFRADTHLTKARKLLTAPPFFDADPDTNLSIEATFSPTVISSDKNVSVKSQPVPNQILQYHNQVAWVVFSQPISLATYTTFTKLLERQLSRHEYPRPVVTLDIDILAVAVNNDGCAADLAHDSASADYFQLLLAQNNSYLAHTQWYGIKRRFPLAGYDKQGFNYLIQYSACLALLPIL